MTRILIYLGILLTGIAIGAFAAGTVMLISSFGDPGGATLTADGAESVLEAAVPESAGAALFRTKTCATCHGPQGSKPIMPDYPEIAGQSADYARQQMRDIKSGARSNGQSIAMKGIMHMVSDEEIVLLAEHISTLSPAPTAGPDPDSEGAKLFATKTCSTCHGPDGKTPIAPEYPYIAGHSAEYAMKQMLDIKSGARSNGQSIAMKGIMHLVTEEQIRLLADYISTMKP